jgi:hypothetical protein
VFPCAHHPRFRPRPSVPGSWVFWTSSDSKTLRPTPLSSCALTTPTKSCTRCLWNTSSHWSRRSEFPSPLLHLLFLPCLAPVLSSVVVCRYTKEGLKWTPLSTTDNVDCIAMLEGKLGLLALLDEESKLQSGTVSVLCERGLVRAPDAALEWTLSCACVLCRCVAHFALPSLTPPTGRLVSQEGCEYAPEEQALQKLPSECGQGCVCCRLCLLCVVCVCPDSTVFRPSWLHILRRRSRIVWRGFVRRTKTVSQTTFAR